MDRCGRKNALVVFLSTECGLSRRLIFLISHEAVTNYPIYYQRKNKRIPIYISILPIHWYQRNNRRMFVNKLLPINKMLIVS